MSKFNWVMLPAILPQMGSAAMKRPVRLSTVGSRAFLVATPRSWNSLQEHVVTAATLQSFKKHLKTFLLQWSYSLAL